MPAEFTIGLLVALLGPAEASSGAAPAGRLAAGPQVLESDMDELAARHRLAAASEQALARLHNTWAERLVRGAKVDCAEPEVARLAAAPALLRLHTERVQAVRAQQDRVAEGAAESTLEALVQGVWAQRLAGLADRTRALEAGWQELSAWQKSQVQPTLSRCQPVLAEAPGLPAPAGREEPAGSPVAVVATGGGRLCPVDEPAQGEAFVVPEGRACYAPTRTCDCTPALVAPGAVLGPSSPAGSADASTPPDPAFAPAVKGSGG